MDMYSGWENLKMKIFGLLESNPGAKVVDYLGFVSVEVIEQLALILNEMAKHAALKLVLKALVDGRGKRINIGKKWYSLH